MSSALKMQTTVPDEMQVAKQTLPPTTLCCYECLGSISDPSGLSSSVFKGDLQCQAPAAKSTGCCYRIYRPGRPPGASMSIAGLGGGSGEPGGGAATKLYGIRYTPECRTTLK